MMREQSGLPSKFSLNFRWQIKYGFTCQGGGEAGEGGDSTIIGDL